jgi:hypothetical protein
MPLKLMYITNNPSVMLIAEKYGVERVFIDMETLGKEERQPHMDTVKSSHTIEDIKKARKILTKTEILVRINSLNDGSEKEINDAINAGADIVMLPYFKNAKEVKKFIDYVNGRDKTCLLFETDDSFYNVDEILSINGIDEAYIGINDMHLCFKKEFMFELLSDGTVEYLCQKFRNKRIPYGFGGIARLKYGEVPAELIIAEHYRLGSSMAIISRKFCQVTEDSTMDEIEIIFRDGISEIREFESTLADKDDDFFIENKKIVSDAINRVVRKRLASKK